MQTSDEELKKARLLLGEKIKHYRRVVAQLSQDALAEKAGVDRSWLINMEKGHANYGIDTLITVVTNCGASFEDFLSGLERSEFPPAHRDLHRDLNTILTSGSRELMDAARVTLDSLAERATRLRRASAKPPPNPDRGEEVGTDAARSRVKEKDSSVKAKKKPA